MKEICLLEVVQGIIHTLFHKLYFYTRIIIVIRKHLNTIKLLDKCYQTHKQTVDKEIPD